MKEQNPGVDLLMSYNWNAVAEALLRQFGTEEGSPYRFGGDALFPELIIPPEEAQVPAVNVAAGAGRRPRWPLPMPRRWGHIPRRRPLSPSSTAASANVVPSDAKVQQSPAERQLAANSPPATVAESIESSPSNPWRTVLWSVVDWWAPWLSCLALRSWSSGPGECFTGRTEFILFAYCRQMP